MNDTYDYDVIVVGGGLAGLSLSCLLGGVEGLRVACLDRDTPETQNKADERTTAISYGSSQILTRANVWEDMVAQGCPIKDIDILDGQSGVLLNFMSKEVEGKPFGWIISNVHLRKTLMNKIQFLANVDHIAPAEVVDFKVSDDAGQVELSDGRSLKARLIVGADGRGSAVRDFMEVDVRQWTYNQQAVVCFIKHEHPHENCAVEHFWPEGPFAILPMQDDQQGGHRSSLVFTEHKRGDQMSLMDLSDEEFLDAVKPRFPERYGEIEILNNKRMAYPLSLTHAAEYIAPRMVLVADAAHGIHPIAGQGLNLGFRDMDTLSQLIEAAYINGEDIGAFDLLQSYQRKRRPDNMAMVAVTDGLVRLFSNDLKVVKYARRFGLRAVSRIGRAKEFFMRRAMGE